MSLCSDLTSFADGELEPARADAFRDHLRTCDACQAGLVEALQLSAQLSTLRPWWKRVLHAAAQSIALAAQSVMGGVHVGVLAIERRWKRIAQWGTGVLVTSGVAALVVMRCTPVDVFAQQKNRPGEIRFAYAGAADHRPPREAMLSASSASDDTQRISFDALSKLEKRGDHHGLAIARAWNGEKAADVLNQLSKLPQTDAIRSDQAAIEVMTTSNDNVQPVLAKLEALMHSEDVAAARAARWNYALVLSRLELSLSAAEAFRAIANEHEAGWSEEANARAKAQAERAQDFKSKWERAYEVGQALQLGGPPAPDDVVGERPGILRAFFYNAVRTATSPERASSLAPMAAVLDRFDHDQHTLGDYVDRVVKLDFGRRGPLARAFADLLVGRPVPEPIATELITETESRDIVDIVMGAMVERDVVADHREWFLRMAKSAGDRWFEIVLARAAADAELARGNVQAAEALLRDGAKRCNSAVSYQCLKLERRRGRLYADVDRVNESYRVLQAALRTARSAGEWEQYRILLHQLADMERFHSATAMVRAYATEVVFMVGPAAPGHDCSDRGSAYRILAGAALIDVDRPDARRYFTESLPCSKPTLAQAILLTDIARLDPRPDDLAQLQSVLSTVRARGLKPGDRLLADETEGRLVIERDPAAGIALLQKTIAATETMIAADETTPAGNVGGAVVARKVRAAAYAVLAFDAARSRDHARVLDLIAHDLDLSLPRTCAVGMVAEDERAAVVVRDAAGTDRGVYDPDRRPSAGALAVPDDLARGLATCAHVTVMASAALQGQPRVLPADLAWSYAMHAHAAGNPPGERRALIVRDVKPPDYLGLAPLAILPPEDLPATTLAGLEATPSSVTAAMTDATEIQLHTHALVNAGVSDASYLALSPEQSDGEYALTAEAIRKLVLRGHPLVVLAACRSAQGARYQHQPWNLPDAFLAAGARAVFATATDIPDAQSGQFFARVMARIRAGADPAAALRDLRIERLRAQPWVADVILFD
jgi:hypothetical protein